MFFQKRNELSSAEHQQIGIGLSPAVCRALPAVEQGDFSDDFTRRQIRKDDLLSLRTRLGNSHHPSQDSHHALAGIVKAKNVLPGLQLATVRPIRKLSAVGLLEVLEQRAFP